MRKVWFRNEQFGHLSFTQEELPQSLGTSPPNLETENEPFLVRAETEIDGT